VIATVLSQLPRFRASRRQRFRCVFLYPFPRDAPEVAEFFDDLKADGFIEGQNLSVLPGGFAVPIDQLGEVADTMARAAPDAIVAGPEPHLRGGEREFEIGDRAGVGVRRGQFRADTLESCHVRA